jgi:hypothetical protein
MEAANALTGSPIPLSPNQGFIYTEEEMSHLKKLIENVGHIFKQNIHNINALRDNYVRSGVFGFVVVMILCGPSLFGKITSIEEAQNVQAQFMSCIPFFVFLGYCLAGVQGAYDEFNAIPRKKLEELLEKASTFGPPLERKTQ